MYIFIKITFSVYIKVIHTYTIKINLCLKLSFFISFFLSDGTQGNKHTKQFSGTDGEGQSHSIHNHYAVEKLTLCIGFQS